MTGDFAAFFEEVRKAARQHGVRAYLVCGVASDGAGGQVKVASNGNHTFDEKNQQFIERCLDAMGESVDEALTRLAGNKLEPTLMN